MDYANDRYWALDRDLKKIESQKYLKPTYKGKTTRKAKRIQAMKRKRDYWEVERWQLKNIPKVLRGMLIKEQCWKDCKIMKGFSIAI